MIRRNYQERLIHRVTIQALSEFGDIVHFRENSFDSYLSVRLNFALAVVQIGDARYETTTLCAVDGWCFFAMVLRRDVYVDGDRHGFVAYRNSDLLMEEGLEDDFVVACQACDGWSLGYKFGMLERCWMRAD